MAQNEVGRWTLGVHGGANVWLSDYNQHKIGDGYELMLRYGISDVFSAGVVAGYEELKAGQDPPFGVPGLTDGYLKLHAITAAMQGFIHFAPNSGFDPYITAGLGSMLYKRINGAGTYIPNSKFSSSVLVPLGIGAEVPISQSVSFLASLGYKITDKYTDYSSSGSLGSFATLKIGVNFIIGGSDRNSAAELPTTYYAPPDTVVKTKTVFVDKPPIVIKDTVTNTVYVPAPVVKDTVVQTNTVVVDRPIVLERGKTVVLKGINFESGKATLTPDSREILRKAYDAMVASPDVQVVIAGHTDSVGNRAYNRDLSVRRAKAVKAWMVAQGIAASRMTTVGRGMDEPIDVNSTAEGRANNRRIEFRVQK